MMQLTNGHHACVLMFMPVVDVLNIPCDCQFVFSALDELSFSHHAALDAAGNILSALIKYEM